MVLSPREELLRLQKKLYKYNNDIIDSSIVVKEKGFDLYEERYKRSVKDYKRIATLDEMMGAVFKADIIYVGDYHTCNQSQRSFLRVLKALAAKDKNFVLALEFIHNRYQDLLDSYMSGRITEETFIKKANLKEHWIFDLWENFKPLFDFARYHNISLYGVDVAPPGSTLLERDVATAKLLAKIIKENPQKRVFVFIGDLHIAQAHLPKEVDDFLNISLRKKSLILFENSEEIYWKLAKEGLDDQVEVVLLPDGNFCRMHTPPIVCQQSYLNWLENDEEEIDYYDAKASFLELVERISDFLKIKLGPDKEEVEVFTCGDLSFLKRLKESDKFSKREISEIKQQILSSESYYIAKTKFVYLANLSLNHAAEEAAHFIKNLCSGLEEPRELVDAFYANILHEALGFFGSKIVNHKRKCFHEKDFEELLDYFKRVRIPKERVIEMETARFIVKYKRFEKKGRALQYTDIFNQGVDLFLSLTHALGYMLGDKLYYGMLKGTISKYTVRSLFYDPWEDAEPYRVYAKLLKTLKRVKIPKRM